MHILPWDIDLIRPINSANDNHKSRGYEGFQSCTWIDSIAWRHDGAVLILK